MVRLSDAEIVGAVEVRYWMNFRKVKVCAAIDVGLGLRLVVVLLG